MSTVSRCLVNRGCNTFLRRPGYLPKSVCWIFLFLKPMAAAKNKNKSNLLFFQTFKRWIIDCMTFQFKELAWVTDCCLIVLTYLKQTNFEQHPLQNFCFKRSNHQSFLPKYFSVNFSNMARCLFLTEINSLLLNFHTMIISEFVLPLLILLFCLFICLFDATMVQWYRSVSSKISSSSSSSPRSWPRPGDRGKLLKVVPLNFQKQVLVTHVKCRHDKVGLWSIVDHSGIKRSLYVSQRLNSKSELKKT